VEALDVVRLASVKETGVGELRWKRVRMRPAVEADPTVVQKSLVGRIWPEVLFNICG
jgi:hypothetical protein